MPLEWSNEKTIYFLELIEQERAIWDPNNKNNKIKHKVHDAWRRVSDKMEVPLEELKMKKKSLMATFRPLMKKKVNSIKYEFEEEDVFKPIWFAFDVMERFLGPLYFGEEGLSAEDQHENVNASLPLPLLLALPFSRRRASEVRARPVSSSPTRESRVHTMPLEWTNERTSHFLELLEHERAIWDPYDLSNSVKREVNDAWMRLSEMMEVPVRDLKAKKKSLMSTFTPLMTKKINSIKCGDEGEDVFIPAWFPFDVMEKFLGPLFIRKEGLSLEDQIPQHDITLSSPMSIQSQQIEMSPAPSQSEQIETPQQFPYLSTDSNLDKKPKNIVSRFDLAEAEKKLNDSFDALRQVLERKKAKEDDCDIHGKMVASRLREYSKSDRLRVMHRINGLLLENPNEVTSQPVLPSPSAARTPLLPGPSAGFPLSSKFAGGSCPLLDLGPIIDSMQNKKESNNKQSNDFEEFSNYLATALKSLPLNLALKAQREIQLLVIEARLKCTKSLDTSSKIQKNKTNIAQSKNAGVNNENRRPKDDSEYPIFQTDTSNDVDDESELDFSETPLPKVEPDDANSVPIEFDPSSIIIKQELIDEQFEDLTGVSMITDATEESRNSGVSSKKKRKLDETQTSDFPKLPTAKSFESKDEFYHFGKGISMQLIRLSKDEAKRCQMEIQKIIQEKMSMAGENFLSRNT